MALITASFFIFIQCAGIFLRCDEFINLYAVHTFFDDFNFVLFRRVVKYQIIAVLMDKYIVTDSAD